MHTHLRLIPQHLEHGEYEEGVNYWNGMERPGLGEGGGDVGFVVVVSIGDSDHAMCCVEYCDDCTVVA